MNALHGLLVNGPSRALVWGQASGSGGPSLAFFVLMLWSWSLREGVLCTAGILFQLWCQLWQSLLVSQWTHCLGSCVSSPSFS